jgi:hypothetical protein
MSSGLSFFAKAGHPEFNKRIPVQKADGSLLLDAIQADANNVPRTQVAIEVIGGAPW